MENKNENKAKEMDEFADELKLFIETLMVRGGASQLEKEQIVTLYAIWKKDRRTDRIGNGFGFRKKSDPNAPATDKQKKALLSFMGRSQIERVDVEGLTKSEASKLLDKAFGKGASAPSSFSSIPGLYEKEYVATKEKIKEIEENDAMPVKGWKLVRVREIRHGVGVENRKAIALSKKLDFEIKHYKIEKKPK